MTKITNTDSRKSRDARIITKSDNQLSWCIAVWELQGSDGALGYQVVRDHGNGTYTYNDTMWDGIYADINAARADAVASGYSLA